MKKVLLLPAMILVISFSIFTSCKKAQRDMDQTASNLAQFEAVILDHSKGDVLASDPIRVVFREAMVDIAETGKALAPGIFRFKPEVSGRTVWEDPAILSFYPENMQFGQNYLVEVKLDALGLEKLNQLPEHKLRFPLHTIPLDFEWYLQPLALKGNGKGESYFELEGMLGFNNPVDSQLVEKMVQIEWTGTGKPGIRWQHSDRNHSLTIGPIQRSAQTIPLIISLKGDVMGLDQKEEKRFLIPSTDDFEVLDAAINRENPRDVVISFSDFLDQTQEFRGLVSLEDLPVEPDFFPEANQLHLIYPQEISGEQKLIISKTVMSQSAKKLSRDFRKTLYFSSPKPALAMPGKGTISADLEAVILPFDAINLDAVDVEIVKVYQNNMMQFLQYNNLDESYLPTEVSEIIWQGKVELNSLGSANLGDEWKRYGLNLMNFIRPERGALYNIRIGFRKSYTKYPCENDSSEAFEKAGIGELEGPTDDIYKSIWSQWYSYPNSSWRDREDPCKPMYYTADNFVQRNLLASNLGLMAKYDGKDKLFVSVTDLKSGKPRSGVELKVYSYQQQLIGQAITEGTGMVHLQIGPKAYFIVANEGNEFGYLKLEEYQTLSMSEFDISGKQAAGSLDGIIFGERGVWRPGDTLFLNFVLRDPEAKIPPDHPVTFELFDPQGNLYYTTTTARHTGPFYSFTCHTDPNAKTGNWQAKVSLGPSEFSKWLKIETVKPNRLKIDLQLPAKEMQLNRSSIGLQVNWLNGLPGKNLKAEVDVELKSSGTDFPGYGDYVFDDIARKFQPVDLTLFRDQLDEKGSASIQMKLNEQFDFPGKLKAVFKVRAYEGSGEFSTQSDQARLSTYSTYVGIKLPKSTWGSPSLETNKTYKLPVVSVDPDGKAKPGRKLTVGLYQAKWHWWWDDSGSELAQYNSDTHLKAFKKWSISTSADGTAEIPVSIEDEGAYLIRICDTESGHCTGSLFYTGYYGGGEEDNSFASKLHFTAEKETYALGDQVRLDIPAGKNSHVLISLESGGEVIQSEWRTTSEDVLKYEFKAEASMFPNIYAHVVVVQGLETKNNDLPLRQYGVLNIGILDPTKKLDPVIQMPDEIKPNAPYEVAVKEAGGNEMYYTLAVVDEGLLDLTRFKTPELYDHFYARKALLTRNWDNFDQVISGQSALYDRIISIGGDEFSEVVNDADKANRFVPVVRHIGPFQLKKGKKATHKLEMMNYSGAVRVMVVAAGKEAYGSAEKTVKVKQDLMALLTAPRVLSPGETIELPVTVFVTDNRLKEVQVTLEQKENFTLDSDRSQMLTFSDPGEKICYFKLKTIEQEGIGKLSVVVKSGNTITRQSVEIDIVNPNVYQKSGESYVLAPGEEKSFRIPAIGMEGSNNAWVELSSMPSLDLENKIRYLIQYPYGCVEQTTSAAFPQLFLDKLVRLSDDRKSKIRINVSEAIDRLAGFRLENSGLSYWPGERDVSPWGSVYAAHFLVEANNLGYSTGKVLPGLLGYLKKATRDFRYKKGLTQTHELITQAYRTMVLAKAGKPEFGAMNYLFKLDGLPLQAKWFLSLGYSLAGKKEVAGQLLTGAYALEDYNASNWNYGSKLRDYAVLLQAFDAAGKSTSAAKLLKEVIGIYQEKDWWNTQTLSWVFVSLSKRQGTVPVPVKFDITYSGNRSRNEDAGPLTSFELSEKAMLAGPVTVRNLGEKELFVRYTSQGKPVMGDEGVSASSNLTMAIRYLDEDNNLLDISRLKQGTEFKAVAKIRKQGTIRNIDEIALNQVFPSGWEILNWRMEGGEERNAFLDYQDVRDDRVYSFFDLSDREMLIEIPLHASYVGNFYLPQAFVEAMYDDEVYAKVSGQWVEVIR